MFDRPALTDEQITQALEARYGLAVSALEFLALGHDANAWTFRATTTGDEALFVKIRRHVDPVRLRLVRFLEEQGQAAVVAPIPALDGALSVAIGELHLVAYPFVDARVAADVGLSDNQWIEYGRAAAALHATRLPGDLAPALPVETFQPAWGHVIDRLHAAAAAYRDEDPARLELAAFWRANGAAIQQLRLRADELGRHLRSRHEGGGLAQFVPCHADLHTHNLFVEAGGGLRVFDWDEAMLAPRERDLMFVAGSPIGLAPGDPELRLFEAGYGGLDIDPETLAYYHIDWAVQDIASYGQQVMLDDISVESRAYALRLVLSIFEPDGEFEVARRHDRLSGPGAAEGELPAQERGS